MTHKPYHPIADAYLREVAMTQTKHTPGPWYVTENGRAVGCGAFMIADIYSAGTSQMANARLIAAAPDGFRLAEMIATLANEEELSTHVEVTFTPEHAARILNSALAFISKVESQP